MARQCRPGLDSPRATGHAGALAPPPGRFDFLIDVETFAFFNYQYILYGMDFHTEDGGGPPDPLFTRIRNFGDQAIRELPSHRDLVEAINLRI